MIWSVGVLCNVGKLPAGGSLVNLALSTITTNMYVLMKEEEDVQKCKVIEGVRK